VPSPSRRYSWGEGRSLQYFSGCQELSLRVVQQPTCLELDLTERGLGVRSKRYAMIVNNGKVELLNIDTTGIDASSAETILAAL